MYVRVVAAGGGRKRQMSDSEPTLSFAKAHATYETGGLVGIMELGIGAVV